MSRSGVPGGWWIGRASAAVLLCVTLPSQVRASEPRGSEEARAALDLCYAAEHAPPETQIDLLERGLAHASAAVAADPDDALAHFAVFCNLGKRVRRDGVSFGTLGEVRRLMREIDLTLSLAPDYPAALSAKGEMLVALPRLLGGSMREGERLARRAVELAPEDVAARFALVEVLEARGLRDDAQAEAEAALALVERSGGEPERSQAEAVVDRLRR